MLHASYADSSLRGHAPDISSADLVSFFVPSGISTYGELSRPIWSKFTVGSSVESSNYIGYVVLALAIYALIRVPRARFWGVAGLIFFLLALGPHLKIMGRQYPIPLPYLLLDRYLPMIRLSGVPARFDVMLNLCLAVMVAYALRAWLDNLRLHILTARLVVVAVAAGIILEYLAIPFPMTEVSVPPFYRMMAEDGERYAIIDTPFQPPTQTSLPSTASPSSAGM